MTCTHMTTQPLRKHSSIEHTEKVFKPEPFKTLALYLFHKTVEMGKRMFQPPSKDIHKFVAKKWKKEDE
ncbi:hypothetical protein POVWA2_007390 [Plasmodium ovale wallikeri]|uniref:Uncharacterized protein n=1 Tax=Plasmodium ovale wallikeri TaxID=864142 RepID=A0A1A8YKE7_PLAOA|nr:hypothetical protein POVWA1_007250 [Plasmodium ovale wallikeri]SBT32037.1 hypothetical protein POVWA2_007390 [Plasmodium ovale wallikeri]